MKGTHISRKTQRRLIRQDDVESLGIRSLTSLIDQQRELLSKYPLEVAWNRNSYLMRRANRARERLRSIVGR